MRASRFLLHLIIVAVFHPLTIFAQNEQVEVAPSTRIDNPNGESSEDEQMKMGKMEKPMGMKAIGPRMRSANPVENRYVNF
ncbi:unnamed protein product [Gongylonema pulchrum]|uniref:Secreted RxLR effector peptide protein n=1 Tax=Gongylonema pulchrum TaxID=637853 RepID=A0A183DG17_9BILA|nr:unnamed protein product [Gongylonema pulchrum]